jgi:hypothetical protein
LWAVASFFSGNLLFIAWAASGLLRVLPFAVSPRLLLKVLLKGALWGHEWLVNSALPGGP